MKESLNAMGEIIKSRNKERIEISIVPGLLELANNAFADDPFEKTHLNFAISRLSKLHNSGFDYDKGKIIKKIIESFVSKPHHTGLFCNFLSLFPNDKDIPDFLIDFLKSEDNIYEGQELKVLKALLRFNFKASQPEIDFFIHSAQDANKHYAIRTFYFLLAGKQGSNRDRETIVDSYTSSFETYLTLAVILSVQELPSCIGFYSRIKKSEDIDEVKQFIDYVKSLYSPRYYLTTENPKGKVIF